MTPWRTPFAHRTYAAGVLWTFGVIAAWLTKAPDQAGPAHRDGRDR